jgi:DNA-binding NarL/FixJ family response regulator
LVEEAKRLQPDVIITDISMPGLNGLDAIRVLKRERLPARIIVLTMHADPQIATQAFRAGAAGYLVKLSAGEELAAAIRHVIQGNVYITPTLAKDLLARMVEPKAAEPMGSDVRLTPRQREVLQLVAEGHTMKAIAHRLNISTRTAESHKYATMDVLGVKSTAELVRQAIRMRLIVL